jgi:hypothetical protein
MSINNDPKWVEVNATGEKTGEKYFGRFSLKPYLTHAETADAERIGSLYTRGIANNTELCAFLITLAYLKFHVVESDALWWKEAGLNSLDQTPFYELATKLREVQKPVDKTPIDQAAPK